HSLDLGRIDVHAARDDHVDPPVADVVVALVVSIRHVAYGEETVAQAVARRVRPVVVLGDPAAADHELTGLADPGFGAVVADQHDLLARHPRAACAGRAQVVRGPGPRVCS